MQLHGGNIDQYQNCLDFSVNLNPLGPPPSVIRALHTSLSRIGQYPPIGYTKLREEIAGYEGVSREQVLCSNGAAELIYAVCQALRPGSALLAVPTFTEYRRALESVDCEITTWNLTKENSFQMTEAFLFFLKERLDAGKKPKILFFCNPNNPTGQLADPLLLAKLLQICEKEAIWLVVDECFLDFVDHPGEHTLVGALKECSQLLILKAFTKRYAIPGIRLGYGLSSNSDLLERISRSLQPWNVSGIAAEAGIAALRETGYVELGQKTVQEGRRFLAEGLRQLGYPVYPSDTNYLLFEGDDNLFAYCVQEGILIRDCAGIEGLKKGYYRTAVRLREENELLLEVLEKAEKRMRWQMQS